MTPWNDLSVIHLLHIAAAELEGPEITSSLISSFQRTILALYTSQPNLFSCGSGLCCIILWRSEWKGFGVFDARHQVTKQPLIVLRFQMLRSPVVGAGVVCIFRCKLLKPIHTKKQHISIPRRTDPRLRGNSAQHKKGSSPQSIPASHQRVGVESCVQFLWCIRFFFFLLVKICAAFHGYHSQNNLVKSALFILENMALEGVQK